MMTPLYLRSATLSGGPRLAGFSTRYGGDAIRDLAEAAGFSPARLYMVTQVHGAEVVEVTGDEPPQTVRAIRADALITAAPGVALAVRTADCVPVLLATVGQGAERVAAVHAGWRGVVAGVLKAAVEAMTAGRGSAAELRASIGPAIGGCCFEVHRDVAETMVEAVGRREIVVDKGPGSRPHVDLREAVRCSLLGAGLRRGRIEMVGPCTRCAAELLHSYRREGGGRGRQVSFIGLRDGV